jgi:hypothetical protein
MELATLWLKTIIINYFNYSYVIIISSKILINVSTSQFGYIYHIFQ